MAVMHFGENNTWININSDLISEYSSIYDTYEIDDEMSSTYHAKRITTIRFH